MQIGGGGWDDQKHCYVPDTFLTVSAFFCLESTSVKIREARIVIRDQGKSQETRSVVFTLATQSWSVPSLTLTISRTWKKINHIAERKNRTWTVLKRPHLRINEAKRRRSHGDCLLMEKQFA